LFNALLGWLGDVGLLKCQWFSAFGRNGNPLGLPHCVPLFSLSSAAVCNCGRRFPFDMAQAALTHCVPTA